VDTTVGFEMAVKGGATSLARYTLVAMRSGVVSRVASCPKGGAGLPPPQPSDILRSTFDEEDLRSLAVSDDADHPQGG
jgi:hypothetical protein